MNGTQVRDNGEKSETRRARLEMLGTRSGWLAHDLDLMLTEATLQTLLALVKTPYYSPAHSHILNAARRIECAAIVTQQLLCYVNGDETEVELLNLNDLVLEIEPLFVTWAGNRVRLQKRLAPDLPLICGRRFQLQQILLNLLMNATEAVVASSGRGRLIQVVTQPKLVQADSPERFMGNTRLAGGRYACLAVHDRSKGLDVEYLEYSLDPEMALKPDAHCTGFRLFRAIVDRHGGGIQVHSVPEEETIFCFCLPTAADTRGDPRDVAGQAAKAILIIDDDRTMVQAAGEILAASGYRPVQASSGPEGIALFQHDHRRLSAVLLDAHMMDMDSLETLQHLQQIDPHVRCILCSDDARAIAVAGKPYYKQLPFLAKPYAADELIRQIEMVLATAQTAPKAMVAAG